MPPSGAIQGELQEQIMLAMWRIGSGTVEQVRAALPSRYRGAYTTAQTVLNRLAERGLLSRTREGVAMVYRPKISEGDYLSWSIQSTLAGASAEARQEVLARLIGALEEAEIKELRRMATRAAKGRR